MSFINKRAVLISFLISIAAYNYFQTKYNDSNSYNLTFGTFVISALLFHMRPELMGRLNKQESDKKDEPKAVKEEDNDQPN